MEPLFWVAIYVCLYVSFYCYSFDSWLKKRQRLIKIVKFKREGYISLLEPSDLSFLFKFQPFDLER